MFNLIVIEYEQIETSMSFHFSLSKWKILKKNHRTECGNTSNKNELFY